MRGCGVLAAGVLALAMSSPAQALSLVLRSPEIGTVSEASRRVHVSGDPFAVTFGLDEPAALNGFSVSVRWDPSELRYLPGSYDEAEGFIDMPEPAIDPARTAVRALSFAPVLTDELFELGFQTLPAGIRADGAPDLQVFLDVSDGTGVGRGLVSSTAGIDVVPEPGTLVLLSVGALVLSWQGRMGRGRAGGGRPGPAGAGFPVAVAARTPRAGRLWWAHGRHAVPHRCAARGL